MTHLLFIPNYTKQDSYHCGWDQLSTTGKKRPGRRDPTDNSTRKAGQERWEHNGGEEGKKDGSAMAVRRGGGR